MRVIEIPAFGPPEVLRIAERDTPSPTAGDVLIRVAAAGVNRPDIVQRYGKYPPPPGASDILGLEVAGHVVAAGSGVRGWHEGDAVCALVRGLDALETERQPRHVVVLQIAPHAPQRDNGADVRVGEHVGIANAAQFKQARRPDHPCAAYDLPRGLHFERLAVFLAT